MLHAVLSYLGNVVLVIWLINLQQENKRLRTARSTSISMTDFDLVYNWIRSGMPEAVAIATPPGFAKDAMRLVWFAKYGEKK